MSSGLLALLDDVASLAKVAATSVDDVAGMAAKAGSKSAGVVIDDTAVSPSYVIGLAANRELPIIWKITKGSLRNKLVFLLPGALVLSLVAPMVITPLLMLGGLFLCFEGAEKLLEWFGLLDHGDYGDGEMAGTPQEIEDQRVASAIKTDFILSAEIMAITLAALPTGSFWLQAAALAVVAIAITFLVYGAVAVIVKADDVGMALACRKNHGLMGDIGRGFGRGLVRAMPWVLKALSTVGTIAMLLVGGNIVLHGVEELGYAVPAHLVHDWAVAVAAALPAPALSQWLAMSLLTIGCGFVLGLLLIPVVTYLIGPIFASFFRKGGAAH